MTFEMPVSVNPKTRGLQQGPHSTGNASQMSEDAILASPDLQQNKARQQHTSCFLKCWRASRAVPIKRSRSTRSFMHVCINSSDRASSWSRLAAAGFCLDAAFSSRIEACRRFASVNTALQSVSASA